MGEEPTGYAAQGLPHAIRAHLVRLAGGAPRLAPLEDRAQSDLWHFDRPSRSPDHPTTKPVALVMRAIQNSSRHGDLVLDAFGGSGTTLIASERTGRRCRMVELAPGYCDVIVRRWEALTGRKASLLPTPTAVSGRTGKRS